MQKVRNMRYTECAILWNIEILKVHVLCIHTLYIRIGYVIYTRTYPKEIMSKQEFHKKMIFNM